MITIAATVGGFSHYMLPPSLLIFEAEEEGMGRGKVLTLKASGKSLSPLL